MISIKPGTDRFVVPERCPSGFPGGVSHVYHAMRDSLTRFGSRTFLVGQAKSEAQSTARRRFFDLLLSFVVLFLEGNILPGMLAVWSHHVSGETPFDGRNLNQELTEVQGP